jgi:lipopolysaccharide/colanic/teichoic acid biosynthesis glycosyltransferase
LQGPHERRRPAPPRRSPQRAIPQARRATPQGQARLTGWAQVNGLRGETETLDKMRTRVRYDIDTMRNGSLGLDLMIIGKTLAVVWRDQNTY